VREYVFTGVVDVECGEDRFEAGPGSFVFLPRNLPHAFRSVGSPVTALLIVTPWPLAVALSRTFNRRVDI
jgi:mannose-6-phosphate isomerase-like protein (cupin superfamily)